MSNSQRASIHYMKNARRFYGNWSRSKFTIALYEDAMWYNLILAAAAKQGDITIN